MQHCNPRLWATISNNIFKTTFLYKYEWYHVRLFRNLLAAVFYYFYSQYGNTSSRAFRTGHVIFRNSARGRVMTSGRRWKKRLRARKARCFVRRLFSFHRHNDSFRQEQPRVVANGVTVWRLVTAIASGIQLVVISQCVRSVLPRCT